MLRSTLFDAPTNVIKIQMILTSEKDSNLEKLLKLHGLHTRGTADEIEEGFKWAVELKKTDRGNFECLNLPELLGEQLRDLERTVEETKSHTGNGRAVKMAERVLVFLAEVKEAEYKAADSISPVDNVQLCLLSDLSASASSAIGNRSAPAASADSIRDVEHSIGALSPDSPGAAVFAALERVLSTPIFGSGRAERVFKLVYQPVLSIVGRKFGVDQSHIKNELSDRRTSFKRIAAYLHPDKIALRFGPGEGSMLGDRATKVWTAITGVLERLNKGDDSDSEADGRADLRAELRKTKRANERAFFVSHLRSRIFELRDLPGRQYQAWLGQQVVVTDYDEETGKLKIRKHVPSGASPGVTGPVRISKAYYERLERIHSRYGLKELEQHTLDIVSEAVFREKTCQGSESQSQTQSLGTMDIGAACLTTADKGRSNEFPELSRGGHFVELSDKAKGTMSTLGGGTARIIGPPVLIRACGKQHLEMYAVKVQLEFPFEEEFLLRINNLEGFFEDDGAEGNAKKARAEFHRKRLVFNRDQDEAVQAYREQVQLLSLTDSSDAGKMMALKSQSEEECVAESRFDQPNRTSSATVKLSSDAPVADEPSSQEPPSSTEIPETDNARFKQLLLVGEHYMLPGNQWPSFLPAIAKVKTIQSPQDRDVSTASPVCPDSVVVKVAKFHPRSGEYLCHFYEKSDTGVRARTAYQINVWIDAEPLELYLGGQLVADAPKIAGHGLLALGAGEVQTPFLALSL